MSEMEIESVTTGKQFNRSAPGALKVLLLFLQYYKSARSTGTVSESVPSNISADYRSNYI